LGPVITRRPIAQIEERTNIAMAALSSYHLEVVYGEVQTAQ
jgi:hypothetical protein